MRHLIISGFFVFALVLQSSTAFSHCEVPCGIYDDEVRSSLIEEHIGTVEKSINKIAELSKDAAPNANQIVRWVNNKEEHANEIQEIASQYFLTQRIKFKSEDNADYQKYVDSLKSLHEIIVYAMKTKQSLDLSNIEALREAHEEFDSIYFGE